MSLLPLDAEALYGELRQGVSRLLLSAPEPVAARQAPQEGQDNPGAAPRFVESAPIPAALRSSGPPRGQENSGTALRFLGRSDLSLVGIWSGGAWLAERLHADLGLPGRHGVISSTLHRDDFSARGLASTTDATQLPFEINGRHILLIDDVLYTGRTIRAVINELFDFGRPASVQLAVLVDRGGREMPIEPAYAAARLTVPASQRLALARDERGAFTFSLKEDV